MASKKPLRAVKPGEKSPHQRRKLSVSEAADSGDHRALLVAMRDRISRAVSAADCPPRDLAALTRRLQDIAKEIEAIDQRVEQEAKENAEGFNASEEWDEEAL